MIKLNLLPPSIDADRKRNIAIAVVVLLLAAEGGGLVAARIKPAADNVRYKARLDSAQADLSRLQKYSQDVAPILAKESGLAPRFDFIKGLVAYNKAYPGLYKRAAGFTYAEVTLLNLEATSNQLKFDAYVTNPADVSRLLLGLSKNPDFQGLPIISNLPGFDEEEQRKRKSDEKAQQAAADLPKSLVIGEYGTGSDLPPGYGGASGASGMPGGGGNGPDAGALQAGTMAAPGGGGNGPGAGTPIGGMSMGAPGEGGVSMIGAGAGGNGPGGSGSAGGGGGSGDLSKFKLEGAVRKPRGFTVTVTCALKNPISRPSYGSSDSQAGGGGGGTGGGSGMMGNGPGGGFSGGSSNGP
jgi:hypothetical protein